MIAHPPRSTMAALDAADRASLAELVRRMRNWMAESPMTERISARRAREFFDILDVYSEK